MIAAPSLPQRAPFTAIAFGARAASAGTLRPLKAETDAIREGESLPAVSVLPKNCKSRELTFTQPDIIRDRGMRASGRTRPRVNRLPSHEHLGRAQ